ncbi:MAG: hypothetical protein KDA42_04340 [Planctomycetales bacterium]|nr:hypothetical protein [Planctomycetales bacterium]
MSIANWKMPGQTDESTSKRPSRNVKWHKIREVRLQQGVSLRSASKRMQMDICDVRETEKPWNDIPVSILYVWQKALEVPAAHLLSEEEEGLSGPVLKRARMIRLMKTAAALKERIEDPALELLVRTLIDQLIEIMPELETVSAWHAIGQRRSLDECGRVAENQLPDDWFVNAAYYSR